MVASIPAWLAILATIRGTPHRKKVNGCIKRAAPDPERARSFTTKSARGRGMPCDVQLGTQG